MEAAITRYRVLANVVGVFLLLLCVGMIVKYGPPGNESMVAIIGPIHGFLYIAYLVTVFDLYFRIKLPLVRVIAMVAAGLVPFLAFVIERRIVRDLRAPGRSADGRPPAFR